MTRSTTRRAKSVREQILRAKFERWHRRTYGYVPMRNTLGGPDWYQLTEDELTWIGYKAGHAAGRRK